MTTLAYAMRIATQLQNEGKLAEACLILNSIVEINPTHADALHLSGIIAYQTGKVSEGIQLIQQAIVSHAANALFHSNLGEMYRQLKNINLSIHHGKQAVSLDPNSASALSNLGIAYYDAEQYDLAEDCHKRALLINPTLGYSLNNMGSIYKALGKIEQASQFYQAAITASQDSAEPRNNLTTLLLEQAEIYHDQGRHIDALTYLDQASSIAPTLTATHLVKGNIFMEMGEIKQAEDQFLKVTQDPNINARAQGHYCLVQLRKIEANNPSLKALLIIVDNIEEVSPQNQMYVYFALGKCYYDMGEWKKAFSYFTQGCHLKRKSITYNMAEQKQLTNQIISSFTKDTIEYLQAFANPSDLPIFIVGMPRSGTTLVEQIIASLPNVHGAGELTYLCDKTKSFYPENISHLPPDAYHSITEKYLANLRDISSNAIRITDKMPQNFTIIGLIHALFPNAKIIHVKRNPIDTCLSCYTKLFSKGQHYSYDLTELGHYYQCYEMIMDHWRRILPDNAWLDVSYEDLIQNTETEAKRLIAYCNLTWDPACLAFYESKRTVRTASFMQVRQPIYTSSLNNWHRFENELAPLIKILNR